MSPTFERPETRYARSGDVHIAFQVFGEGDVDLVLVRGFLSDVDLAWDLDHNARALIALAGFARVIVFDRRGIGRSDRVTAAPMLEERMDDLRAVMDAAGSERAAILGLSEGVPTSILFAATYPERVHTLICWGGMARGTSTEGYPYGRPADVLMESWGTFIAPYWGQGVTIESSAPSQADDDTTRRWYGRLERSSVSPGMLVQLGQVFFETDVRHVVPSVHVPALVLHRRHDLMVDVRHSRWLAEHLPDARLVEIPGNDHAFEHEHFDLFLGEVQEFLTGVREAAEPERVLATVLFTDIVDSTRTAAALGDRRWREVLEHHAATVERTVERFGGRLVKSLGDGFLVTFGGPARAIRCAAAIADAAREDDGVRVRAGVHTGECEVMGDDLGGIAVHIAARVSALAQADEVLVSRTVKDLVAGSGLTFDSRGAHELKGVPDAWELYAVGSGI